MSVKETKKWNNTINQYFATITVDLIMFAHGAAMGQLAPALPFLSSKDTPLESGPLTNDQISWIGSINSFGAIIGNLSFGYLISVMGSKRAILLLAIPEVLFWVLIYFGNHYYYILIARVLNGYAGGGILTSLILYISEIANDDIRGRLGSSMMFLRNIGILIGYILGATVGYFTVPCISITFPIVFAIVFAALPNTPLHYFAKGQTQKAKSAFKFYKGYNGQCQQDDDRITTEFERLKSLANDRKTEEKIKMSDYWKDGASRGFMTGFALNAFAQFTLNFTIISYAVTIFEKTGTSIDPYISSIVLALALIVGSLLTTYLADMLGRKILNIVSCAGSAIGLFTLSIYYYFYINDYNLASFVWVPVVSLSFVVFISSAGINALAYVCSVECIPAKIRTSGYVIICVWISVITFICTKLFPILLAIVDLHGCMTIFGICSTIGAIFVARAMNETSGKSLDDVGSSGKDKKVHDTRIC